MKRLVVLAVLLSVMCRLRTWACPIGQVNARFTGLALRKSLTPTPTES